MDTVERWTPLEHVCDPPGREKWAPPEDEGPLLLVVKPPGSMMPGLALMAGTSPGPWDLETLSQKRITRMVSVFVSLSCQDRAHPDQELADAGSTTYCFASLRPD